MTARHALDPARLGPVRRQEIGGCAHDFYVGLDGRTIPSAALEKDPDTPVFCFEAGPSLYSGLSQEKSPNVSSTPSTKAR